MFKRVLDDQERFFDRQGFLNEVKGSKAGGLDGRFNCSVS